MTGTPTRSEQRRSRAASADDRLSSLWEQAVRRLGVPAAGAALVAVGGYGRGELSPASDLDVVLVGGPGYDDQALAGLAEALWYPLWDAGVPLDRAVRNEDELPVAAHDDLRVALGLLDMRHVVGDGTVTLRARAQTLVDWRREAKHRLPVLAAATRERWARTGDLAHATTPDLKDAQGGLRDVTMLRSLLASWLVDVPAAELERLATELLEVRDALHETSGRRSDRLVADDAADVASRLGLPDAEALRASLMTTGRAIGHLSSVALRNVDWVLAPARPSGGGRRPVFDVVAPGVGAYRGEVVLTEKAAPSLDPLLGLRAAEAAAARGLVLTDSAAARLGRELAPMPLPWPPEARSLLTRLLASGTALPDVWESLDAYGVIDRLIPEWKRVRYLAPQSPVHRYTVDRHLVQTCVEAAAFVDRVARPDLLVVAALLHDIGKADEGDHSEVGEVMAGEIAGRMGFVDADCATIAALVRHHLALVQAATSQDLDDPLTAQTVAAAVGDLGTLRLLDALTEADALATGPNVWSAWRRQLLTTLGDRVAEWLTGAAGAIEADQMGAEAARLRG